MADSAISQYLKKILAEVYGKDVRQSIHDAIHQCYEDVNSPELNIEAFETAVQNKIDSGELATMTLGDKSVTSEKIADQCVTERKLDGNLRDKFVLQSSLLKDVEFTTLTTTDVADLEEIEPTSYKHSNWRLGNRTLIPIIPGTAVYIKVFSGCPQYSGADAQVFEIDCYDNAKKALRVIGNSAYQISKRTIASNNYLIYKFKIPLENDVAYVRIRFCTIGNLSTTESVVNNIMSYSDIPMDEDITNENYKFVKSDELDRHIGETINSYYHFSQIGRIIEKPEHNYTCWSHDMLHYDSVKDRFVQTMKSNSGHGSSDGNFYISYIDPETLKATVPAEIQLSDGINHVTWGQGFWINASGQYVVIGTIGTVRDTSAKYHKIISSDHGATWNDDGEISLPSGYESYYFHSCHLLSNGRVLGVVDDGSIPAGTSSTMTKIFYSDDDGLNWSVVDIPAETSSVEQNFIEIDDTIIMIGRENNYRSGQNCAIISFSQDNGETWTKAIKSGSLTMHCSNAVSFVHGDVVEVFTLSRYYTKQGKKNGIIRHYIATKKEALLDTFTLVECFYGTGYEAACFHAPGLAMDALGNVLVSYSDSVPSSATPTELHFLYGTQAFDRRAVCDGRASDVLPYSGAKVEEMITELISRIDAIERTIENV